MLCAVEPCLDQHLKSAAQARYRQLSACLSELPLRSFNPSPPFSSKQRRFGRWWRRCAPCHGVQPRVKLLDSSAPTPCKRMQYSFPAARAEQPRFTVRASAQESSMPRCSSPQHGGSHGRPRAKDARHLQVPSLQIRREGHERRHRSVAAATRAAGVQKRPRIASVRPEKRAHGGSAAAHSLPR